MKQVLTFILFLSGTHLFAQNVGLNITSPEYTLDIRSFSIESAGQLNISNLDKSRYVRFFTGSDAYPDPSMTWKPGHSFLFASYDDLSLDFTEYMRINAAGDVGIGISNPEARLDIKGGDWNLDAGNPGDLRIGNSDSNLRIGVATGGGGAGISRIYSSNHLILGVDDEPIMQIDAGGETGFGTNNPTQKVHINGKLKVGNDTRAPSEGTIRYNATNNSFEGYDGTKWINLGGSSPYGAQGTFNLPNSNFELVVPGNPSSIRAVQDLVLIKSSEEIQTGWDSSVPPNPIYAKVIHINLFKKNNDSSWSNVLSIDEEGPIIGNLYAKSIALSEDRLLIGNPAEKEVKEYSYFSGFWWSTNTFESPDNSINDYFGSSVAMYEEMTIIGAPAVGFLDGPNGPGKAYVYDENDELDGTLGGPGAETGDKFGADVDITLNRAIVGAPGNDYGSISNAGSATVFNRLNGNWSSNSTWYDDTIEEDEGYGGRVAIENEDYFYIMETNGIDSYLVEGGYWVLKETITNEEGGYNVTGFLELSFDKIAYWNYSNEDDEITFLAAAERDENNIFVKTSSLINGDTAIQSYAIVNDGVYTLGSNDEIYFFEY